MNDGKMEAMCRCCLNLKATNGIFDRCTHFNIPYSKMIFDCSSIPVAKNDKLPALICDTCIINLKIAYSFKVVCTDSYQKLTSPIKIIKDDVPKKTKNKVKVCNHRTLHWSSGNKCPSTKENSKNAERRFPDKVSQTKCTRIGDQKSFQLTISSVPYEVIGKMLEGKIITYKLMSKNSSLINKEPTSHGENEKKKGISNTSLLVNDKLFINKNRSKKHTTNHSLKLRSDAKKRNNEVCFKCEHEKNANQMRSKRSKSINKIISEEKPSNIPKNKPSNVPENRIDKLLDGINSLQLDAIKTEQTEEIEEQIHQMHIV